MTFLIDGYNLMHAVGLLGTKREPRGLERARKQLLDWLAGVIERRPDVLRVVFDAEKGQGKRATPEAEHRGVRVRFAFRRTADDEIEELLAVEQLPARITVVSNDTRIQDAARRRGAAVQTCQEFVDWCIADHRSPGADTPGSPQEEKPADAGPDEMAAWLTAFSTPKKPRKPR